MEKELLFTFIRQPDQISAGNLQDLKDVISNYPYFQSAHLLLLYNLKKINQEQFDKQLRKSAAYVSDRQVLFNLLYGFNSGLEVTEPASDKVDNDKIQNQNVKEKEAPKVAGKKDDSLDLLEIDDNQKVTTEATEIKIETFAPTENINVTANQVPDFELEDEKPDHSSFDLIEKFIEENPAFIPNRLDLSETREDISVNSIVENDDMVTETLAMVYANQKLYEKAITIYEKLILKFPEKKAYFATRIENLRNNIK
jgi:tetratricopeptide (TPR) repeat protein